jgi:hypothetical protein
MKDKNDGTMNKESIETEIFKMHDDFFLGTF